LKPKGKPVLATKPKPKPGAKPKPYDPSGTAAIHDKFKIIEVGLDEAAKKWLRQRGVNTLDVYLWTAQLDSEETSIEFQEWAKRVGLARKEFEAAGWMAVLPGSGPQLSQASYWARIAAVDVGISFGCVDINLHEIRKDDPEFRSAVSESGFRSIATGDSCPDPEILMRDIERIIERERKTRKFPKGITKAAPPAGKLLCPKGCDIIGALEAKRKAAAATAIAKRSDVPAMIDVPSTPAEKLSSDERKTLSHCEKTIKQGATAFLEMGDALTVIQEQRLYRERYSTFEAYLWEEFHLERSVAYRWIKAAATHLKASAIADKLSLSITNEAQLRALETVVETQDLQAVLRRAARKITPNAEGLRVPTAKILAEAVREEFTAPEDLKRQKETARMRSQQRPAVELIDQAEREEKAAADIDEARLEGALKTATFVVSFDKGHRRDTLADIGEPQDWLQILRGPKPEDGSDPGYWHGRPRSYARQLHGVATIVQRLAALHLGQAEEEVEFRNNLSSLLRSLAEDISGESTLLAGLGTDLLDAPSLKTTK
jgi:hypothetical protein